MPMDTWTNTNEKTDQEQDPYKSLSTVNVEYLTGGERGKMIKG
jgi:hypothetical protein